MRVQMGIGIYSAARTVRTVKAKTKKMVSFISASGKYR